MTISNLRAENAKYKVTAAIADEAKSSAKRKIPRINKNKGNAKIRGTGASSQDASARLRRTGTVQDFADWLDASGSN